MSTFAEVEVVGFNPMRKTEPPEMSRRKSDKKKQWVSLKPKLWADLKYAAKFATRVFHHTGQPETVSRNDFIEDSLTWAIDAYWKDKGGAPTNDEEFEKKAAEHAAKLMAREASAVSD